MTIDANIVLAFVAVILGGGGIAAWRRSNKEDREADNQQSQAAANMVSAANDVVTLLRREMKEQQNINDVRHEELASEVQSLHTTVTAWDGWADRVLDILDKAVGLLTDEQKADLRPDVTHAKDTRPPRYRHYHDKMGKQHDGHKPAPEGET